MSDLYIICDIYFQFRGSSKFKKYTFGSGFFERMDLDQGKMRLWSKYHLYSIHYLWYLPKVQRFKVGPAAICSLLLPMVILQVVSGSNNKTTLRRLDSDTTTISGQLRQDVILAVSNDIPRQTNIDKDKDKEALLWPFCIHHGIASSSLWQLQQNDISTVVQR